VSPLGTGAGIVMVAIAVDLWVLLLEPSRLWSGD